MDLNLLTLFEAVARTASFSAAARELGLPKSSASRGLARLEDQLGVQLLFRTTRHVSLTSAGIRTLLMSGYSRDQASLQDDPARGAMFLAKPFTNDSLVAKVRELLAAPARDVHVPAA